MVARRKSSSRIRAIPARSGPRNNSAWDKVFLGPTKDTVSSTSQSMPGQNNRRSLIDMNAVQIQAAQNTAPEVYQEIQMALNGDDSLLLPYQPTPTINPGRPRTLAAGYDARSMTLRIRFRDGDYYTYYNVPPSIWFKFTRASSPGRFINTTLNGYAYNRGL